MSGVMAVIPIVPIPLRIVALMQERNNLFAYPMERLAAAIQETGFRCDGCSKCCTRAFNGHVFLLDWDVTNAHSIDPAALVPAPDPEFCDQNGTFYVSGFAVRTKDDATGTCWFLEDGRCRIYGRRFSICRIYPYMLRRVPGADGKADWRHVSRPGEHGKYHQDIPMDECLAFARKVKEYENAFLTQEISFLDFIRDYFARRKLRHVQGMYDLQMQRFSRGEPVMVMAYHAGQLCGHMVTRPD